MGSAVEITFHKLIVDRAASKGFVSAFYTFLLKASYKDLLLDRLWRKDVLGLKPDFDWGSVWANVLLTSRNPDHQQIHLNYAHRTYLTPRRLHLMIGVISVPWGPPEHSFICSGNAHPLCVFGRRSPPNYQIFSFYCTLSMPVSITVLLLNDLSQLLAHGHQKRLIFACHAAAKKLIAMRWKHPDKLSLSNWFLTLLDGIYMELSTARVIRIKESNIDLWRSAAEKLKEQI